MFELYILLPLHYIYTIYYSYTSMYILYIYYIYYIYILCYTTTNNYYSSSRAWKHTLSLSLRPIFHQPLRGQLAVSIKESTLYMKHSSYIKNLSVEPTFCESASSDARCLQLLVLKLPAHVLGFQLFTIHWHLRRSFKEPFMVFICAAPASCSHFVLHRCCSLRQCSR